MQNFDERGADAMEAGLRAAKLTPMQVRIFWIAFERALGLKPLTNKEIKEMEPSEAWKEIDSGLRNLMSANDELSDGELVAKSRRLTHLSKFVATLTARVNERLQDNIQPGSIDELFNKYVADRLLIDEN